MRLDVLFVLSAAPSSATLRSPQQSWNRWGLLGKVQANRPYKRTRETHHLENEENKTT